MCTLLDEPSKIAEGGGGKGRRNVLKPLMVSLALASTKHKKKEKDIMCSYCHPNQNLFSMFIYLYTHGRIWSYRSLLFL